MIAIISSGSVTPLGIPLSTIKILEQKLEYIHNSPVVEKWALCSVPEDYRWSSARFYLSGIDEFGFPTGMCLHHSQLKPCSPGRWYVSKVYINSTSRPSLRSRQHEDLN